jgi:hypothetical protein
MDKSDQRYALAAFAFALAGRLVLIATYPTMYSMDAYQRWGGRAHLLVQDWLPATQSIVWLTNLMGGGQISVRVAVSIVAAIALAAGGLCARRMGGPAAGWAFLPVTVFGPSLTWTSVPYQEGTFMLFLFGGMALALTARAAGPAATPRQWMWADLIFGGLALVRYEGWPVTILYILWRRDRRALLASWGILAWLSVKAMGIQGYTASPIHYADWEGLDTRFDWDVLGASIKKFGRRMLKTGSGWLYAALVPAAVVLLKKKVVGTGFFLLVLGGQLLITVAWMTGLETSIIRMHLLPGTLSGLIAAVAVGIAWPKMGGRLRPLALLAGVALVIGFGRQGLQNARASLRSVKHEVRLIEKIEQCDDCRFVVRPRKKIGTRDRHDGCEIIQGISAMLHERDFWCLKWGKRPDTFTPTHVARWKKGGYVIRAFK